jgi:hypothetical protein
MSPDGHVSTDPALRGDCSTAPVRSGRALSPNRPPPSPPGLVGLEGLYERYCDRQARELLQLIPREGLRALARRARQEWPPDRAPDDGIDDPLARAVRMARRLLPLPPYPVWVREYVEDRGPFLEALGIEDSPARREPVLVEVRSLPDGWTTGLHLYKREGEWRGFLQFTRGLETGDVHRTAEIFRGGAPREIRQRFRDYRLATLEAFLRSIRP